MDDLLSEKEQIDQIRQWWSEYGGYVIGGLAIGIASLVGFNFYQSSKLEAQLAGSALYESLAGHVVSGDLDEAEAVVADLSENHADTVYAPQAKLALARLYMDKNRDQDAADALQEVLDSNAGDEVKHLARTRLARILLYQGNAEAVVELLDGQNSEAFAATYNDLLGDAYVALGRADEAAAAYQAVMLDPAAQATVDQEFVQWKSLDIATEPASLEEPVAEEPAADDAAEEPAQEDGE